MTPEGSSPIDSRSRYASVASTPGGQSAFPGSSSQAQSINIASVAQQHTQTSIPIPSSTNNRYIRQQHSTFLLNSPFGHSNGIPNSLSAFASSVQRAQSFRSLEPRLKASRSYFQDDEELIDPDTLAPSQLGRKISTVFHDFRKPFDSGSTFDEAAVDDASFIDHSFNNQYGSISGNNNYPDISRTPSFISHAPSASFVGGSALARVLSNDAESLFVRQVETNSGKTLTMLTPRSTVPQTIFNSINVLIGVGLLALSKAMTYAGWYWGMALLAYSASITYWTASLLAACMETDPTLLTYADLGYKAYGAKARLFISLLFSVELLGCGVSLIVLFSDSFNAFFPEISTFHWKIIGFVFLTPFSFLQLRVLSGISLFGISATISLVLIVVTLGLSKPTSPGSLIDPMPTNLYPDSVKDLLIAYGIILGPFGSHSLFPALKADMANPNEFKKCLKITYLVGFFADSTMALTGFAMFGTHILNEITKSIVITKGYPSFIYPLVSILISMVPISKTPLNALPIINIIEFMFDLTPQQLHEKGISSPSWKQKIGSSAIKVFVNFCFLIVAILYPEFDRIIGISGASLCTIICVILPCGFYVRLCHPKNTWFYYLIMLSGAIIGTCATIANLV